ncbi:MAG: hypothetical protein Q9227_002420 [Pyrenula ochraceoflavens]
MRFAHMTGIHSQTLCFQTSLLRQHSNRSAIRPSSQKAKTLIRERAIPSVNHGQSTGNTRNASEKDVESFVVHDPTQLARSVRHTMRRVPQSITIVTSHVKSHTDSPDTVRGATISTFSVATLEPDPYVSFWIKRPSALLNAIHQSKAFQVHFPKSNYIAGSLADRFATRVGSFFIPGQQKTDIEPQPDNDIFPLTNTVVDSRWGRPTFCALRCELDGQASLSVGEHCFVLGKVVHVATQTEYTLSRSQTSRCQTSSTGLVYLAGKYRDVSESPELERIPKEQKLGIRFMRIKASMRVKSRYRKDQVQNDPAQESSNAATKTTSVPSITRNIAPTSEHVGIFDKLKNNKFLNRIFGRLDSSNTAKRQPEPIATTNASAASETSRLNRPFPDQSPKPTTSSAPNSITSRIPKSTTGSVNSLKNASIEEHQPSTQEIPESEAERNTHRQGVEIRGSNVSLIRHTTSTFRLRRIPQDGKLRVKRIQQAYTDTTRQPLQNRKHSPKGPPPFGLPKGNTEPVPASLKSLQRKASVVQARQTSTLRHQQRRAMRHGRLHWSEESEVPRDNLPNLPSEAFAAKELLEDYLAKEPVDMELKARLDELLAEARRKRLKKQTPSAGLGDREQKPS